MRHLTYYWLLIAFLASAMLSCTNNPDANLGDRSAVVYECNERLFAQTKAFQEIEKYVPELERMQVNVLWLMPIHPRGTKNSVNSPYCVKNYRAIDPAFGTMDDLISLVNTCHEHHMLVILDWVANHTAWDHSWVTAHPDWYQEAQTADEKMWNDVTFLDYSNQAVRDSMTACMLYWVDEANIDGFRCDYAHGVPNEFWKQATTAILQVKPNAFLLAETQNAGLYNAGFGLIYSWNYLTGIENLYSGKTTVKGLISISDAEFRNTPEGKDRLRYVTTHDECSEKAPKDIFKTAAGEMSAFCLTIFMGGTPMIYSSQEIGYIEKINFFNYKILSFVKAAGTQIETRNAYATLLKAYQDTRDIRKGTKNAGTMDDKVPYVEYTQGESRLLVICNHQNSAQIVTLPAAYQAAKVKDMKTGQEVTLASNLNLTAYEYRIFRKD